MNIIGIIPARMASNRFPGKPLVEIAGRAMIYHVYWRSKMSKVLNCVYVATCDREIEDYCRRAGIKVVMTADTHERATDRAAEAVVKIEKETKKNADIVVMIQGDEPMVFPEMIDSVVRPVVEKKDVRVANLMAELKNEEEEKDPNIVKVVVGKDNNALYFSREAIPSRKKAKGAPPCYKQVPIIPFARDFLITFNKLPQTPLEIIESVDMLRLLEHGYAVRMVPSGFSTYGVDTPRDLERVGKLMQADPLIPKYSDKGAKNGK
ncbi:MAG: 3-deoxy-manno-octulosonate cytidylyltransferase [Omnitrophica bacterium]|nr:3-deoxy-manno-octulosonate cytidylyltransferase [Candidatus Omnitrophota bacterium]